MGDRPAGARMIDIPRIRPLNQIHFLLFGASYILFDAALR